MRLSGDGFLGASHDTFHSGNVGHRACKLARRRAADKGSLPEHGISKVLFVKVRMCNRGAV